MKKLAMLRFWGIFFLLFCSFSFVQGQYTQVPGGQVRLAFETKVLTQEEAEQAVRDGYIDLWTYAWFNKAFIDEGYFTVEGSRVTNVGLTFQAMTHSYKLITADGQNDEACVVAEFAPYTNTGSCPSTTENAYQDENTTMSYGATASFMAGDRCPTWAYTASSDGAGAVGLLMGAEEYDGGDWIKFKLYPVRFEYKQAGDFHVKFFSVTSASEDYDQESGACVGATGFTIRTSTTSTPLVWEGWCEGQNTDWVMGAGRTMNPMEGCVDPDRADFIPGGVEVVSGLDGVLTLNPACPGTDMQGALSEMALPSGQTWANYQITYSLRTGDSFATLNYGTDIRVSPDLTAAAIPDYSVVLTKEALAAHPGADSLIITFQSNTTNETLRLSAPVEIYTVVDNLLIAFSDEANAGLTLPIYEKTEAGRYDEILVEEGTRLVGKPLCTYPAPGSNPTVDNLSCYYNNPQYSIGRVELFFSSTATGRYSSVAGGGTFAQVSSAFQVAEGYYFLRVTGANGCYSYTDTVHIRIPAPLTAPILSLNTMCGQGLLVSATIDADVQPTNWEWGISPMSSTATEPADNGTYVIMGAGSWVDGGSVYSSMPGWEIRYSVSEANGENTSYFKGTMGSSHEATGFPFCYDGGGGAWPLAGNAFSGEVTIHNTSDQDKFVNTLFYARCFVDGRWSPWGMVPGPAGTCVDGSFEGDFSMLSMGVSATSCVSSSPAAAIMGCTTTDTAVTAGSPVRIRLWLQGRYSMAGTQVPVDEASNLSQTGITVYWQVKEGEQWKTWASTGYNNFDQGALLQSPSQIKYTLSPERVVSQTETYRAVIVANGCGRATTDEDDTNPEGGYDGDHGLDGIGSPSMTTYGTFDDEVTVTVKTDAGTISASIDEGAYNTGNQVLCYGQQLDLRLQDYSASAGAVLHWQVASSQTGPWADVNPAVTGEDFYNVPVADGDDLLAGRTVWYRVNIVDGASQTATDPIQVTIYKAGKLYTGYMDMQQRRKSTTAGYCDGEMIFFIATETRGGNTPVMTFPGTGYESVGFQILEGAALNNDFPAPDGSMSWVNNSGNYPSRQLSQEWTSVRVVSQNHGCYAFGDTVYVKKNAPVSMGTVSGEPSNEVCGGSEVTLTVSGGNCSHYIWRIPVAGSGNGSDPTEIVAGNNSSSLTETFPISTATLPASDWVRVDGYRVYGAEADTTHCYAATSGGYEVKTKECTLPAPVVQQTPVCQGSEGELVTWKGEFDANSKLYVGEAADVEGAHWQELASPADFTYRYDDAGQTTFTLTATGIVLSSPGTYYFHVEQGGVKSEASGALEVNPLPKVPSVTSGPAQTFCSNATGTITAEVVIGEAEGEDYAYRWYKADDHSLVATTDGPELTFGAGGDAAMPQEGTTTEYYLLVEATYTATGCSVVSEIPASKTSVSVEACSSDNMENVEQCPADPVAPMVLTYGTPLPASVIWQQGTSDAGPWETAQGTSSCATSISGKQCTFTPTSKPAAGTTVYYRATVNRNGQDYYVIAYYRVWPEPVINSLSVQADAATYCGGSTISLTSTVDPASPAHGAYTYAWTGPDNFVSTEANPTVALPGEASFSGVYTLQVSAVSEHGCTAEKEASTSTVTVHPLPAEPQVDIAGSSQTVCEGSAFSLQATVTPQEGTDGVQYTYSWSGPGVGDATGSNTATLDFASLKPEHAGQYTLTVTATANGCSVEGQGTFNLSVSEAPEIGISALTVSPSNVLCAGSEVTFATGGGTSAEGYTYTWTHPVDGVVASAENQSSYTIPAVDAEDAGQYKVEIGYAQGGCEATPVELTAELTVHAAAVAATIATEPASATLCVGSEGSLSVEVTQAPAQGSTYTYNWYKDGKLVWADAGSSSASSRLAFGASAVLPSSQASSGSYYVWISTTTENGCSDSVQSASATLSFVDCAEPTLASVTACPGEEPKAMTFTYSDPVPTTVLWQVDKGSGFVAVASGYTSDCNSFVSPSGTCSFTPAAEDVPPAGGQYTFRAVIDQGLGTERTCEATYTVHEQAAALTITSIAKTPDQASYCEGTALSLNPVAGNEADFAGIAWQWATEDGVLPSAGNTKELAFSSLLPEHSGTYTVSATATDMNGCVASAPVTASVEITVDALPVITSVSIEPSSTTVCAGSEVSLVATVEPATASAGSYAYAWTSPTSSALPSGDGALTGLTLSLPAFDAAGSHTYQFTVTATNGLCTAEQSATATVKVVDSVSLAGLAVVSDAAEAEVCVEEGAQVTLSLQMTSGALPAGAQYQWYKDGVPMPSETGATLALDKALASIGTYTCSVTVPASADIPCASGPVMAAGLELAFVVCEDNDPLSPVVPSDPDYAHDFLLSCPGSTADYAQAVTYMPQSESSSITKVEWFVKEGSDFADGVEGGTSVQSTSYTAGSEWTKADTLQASKVFAGKTGPVRLFVRAQVTRTAGGGELVSSTASFEFLLMGQTGQAAASIEPLEAVVCQGSPASFAVEASQPAFDASAYTAMGVTASQEELSYLWMTPGSSPAWQTGAETYEVAAAAASDAGTYYARVVSSNIYMYSGYQKACPDTASALQATLAVNAPASITDFADADGLDSKTVCAGDLTGGTAGSLPALTVTVAEGSVVCYLHSTNGTDWDTMQDAGNGLSYTLQLSDVALPEAGGAAVTNTYRVVVGSESCPAVTADYVLTVQSDPDVASVSIDAGTATLVEGVYTACGPVILTASALAADGSETDASLTLSYQWQQYDQDGASWQNVAAGGTSASYELAAPASGQYRCVVTAQSGASCRVQVESAGVAVRADEATVAGTLSIDGDSDFCSTASSGPVFTLSGHTGSITAWQASNRSDFAEGASTVSISESANPFTLDLTQVSSLLDADARKTTLYVRPVVRSGAVCGEAVPQAVSFTVYAPSPVLTLSGLAGDALCDLSAAAEVGFSPALAQGEQIVWEFAGKDFASAQPEEITTVTNTGNLNLPSSLEPTYADDTVIYVRARTTNGVCASSDLSAVLALTVKRSPSGNLAVAPAATNPVCEGSEYSFSVTRPAEAALTWTVSKDAAAAEAVQGVVFNPADRTETLTVSDAQPGTYLYTIADRVEGCGEVSTTYTVTVNAASSATGIEAANNGQFCSGATVTATATVFAPASAAASLQWQVCTNSSDYEGSRLAALEMTGEQYSMEIDDAGTYYVRYVVPGTDPCPDAYSPWATVEVFASPEISDFVSALGSAHSCAGSEVELSFTAQEGLSYRLYSNKVNAVTGGTLQEQGTVPAGGQVVCTVNPDETTYYYVELENPDYTAGGDCGTSVSASCVVVNVDAQPVAGTLVFANAADPAASEGGLLLEATTGQTGILQLSGAEGIAYELEKVSTRTGTPADFEAFASAGAMPVAEPSSRNYAFGQQDMDTTYFRVKVSNGVCAPVYSNLVKAVVSLSEEPYVEAVSSTICISSAPQFTLSLGGLTAGNVQWQTVKLQRRGPVADGSEPWEDVAMSALSEGVLTGTAEAVPSAGRYEYRIAFTYNLPGSGTEERTTLPVSVSVDALSVAGTLAIDVPVACEYATPAPLLSLSGQTGSVTGLDFGKVQGTWTGTRTPGSDPAALYRLVARVADSGWYRASVKNGVCPAVYTNEVLARILPAPEAGSLQAGNVLCFGEGTTEVTLSGNTASTSIQWQTSDRRNGDYTAADPSTDNQASFTVGPLTDRLWVQAVVSYAENVCGTVSTQAVAVNVYDTLIITQQPEDEKIVGTGTATFTVAASTAGLRYGDGSGQSYEAVSPQSYQWQKWDGLAWADLSDDAVYSGCTTATLTVAGAQDHDGERFRCVVTSTPCDREVVSEEASITTNAALDPGSTESLTDGDCYYYGSTAVYEVTGASGEGTLSFEWQVLAGSDWMPVEAVPALTGRYSVSGSRIEFEDAADLTGASITRIRACVKDDNNTDCTNFSAEMEVCAQEAPSYAFVADSIAVCAGTASNADFRFSASDLGGAANSFRFHVMAKGVDADYKALTAGSPQTVTLHDGSSVSVVADPATGNITVNQPIPVAADGLRFKVEVLSSYSTGVDTVLYAVLRVDAPLAVATGAVDQTVCEGSGFAFQTSFTRGNPDLETEVTAEWYYVEGTAQKQGDAVLDWVADPHTASYTGASASPDVAGTWELRLSTSVCTTPVTDQVELAVKSVPAFDGDITGNPAENCAGEQIALSVAVDEGADAAVYDFVWQKQEGEDWVDLTAQADSIAMSGPNGATPATLTLEKTSPESAGLYRAVLRVTEPAACATEVASEPLAVKIKIAPVLRLNPAPQVFAKEGATAAVTAERVPVADLGYDADYVVMEEPASYTWWFMGKGQAAYTQANGVDAWTDLVVAGTETAATVRLNGLQEYDSTLFYVQASNSCGEGRSLSDTLRVNDRFAISRIEAAPSGALCSNDETALFTVTAYANMPASGMPVWEVSTNGGLSWETIAAGEVPGQAPASYAFGSDPATYQYTLSVARPTAAMDGWQFRVTLSDGTDSDVSDAAALQVDAPAWFLCADEEALSKSEPVVVIGGTPASSLFEAVAACLPGSAPYDGYTFAYELKGPADADYAAAASGLSYTFPAAGDTGTYYVRFSATNHCGGDTVVDSVRVINILEPGSVSGIETTPDDPDDPDVPADSVTDAVGPQAGDLAFTVCEGNSVRFVALAEGGPAEETYWEVDMGGTGAYTRVDLSDPRFAVVGDTLLVKPVAAEMENWIFRRVFDMPGNVATVYSPLFTLHVNAVPDAGQVRLLIVDVSDEADQGKMAPGQALAGNTVELRVVDADGHAYQGADRYCFMRYEPAGAASAASETELACQASSVYRLTGSASALAHDSTLYFVRLYNECGFSESEIGLLRVFDTLVIEWVPDTVIYLADDEVWTEDSLADVLPGDVVVVASESDSLQLEAHLFACQESEVILTDTVMRGFMNASGTAAEGGSSWQYRPDAESPWVEILAGDAPWSKVEIEEDFGRLTFTATPEMDGFQIRGVAVNDHFADTTAVLTLHVLPVLAAGDLQLTPSDTSLCREGEVVFRLSDRAGRDLQGLDIGWQLLRPGSASWAELDSLQGRTMFDAGLLTRADSGLQVRVVASSPCGADTAYARVSVEAALAPWLTLDLQPDTAVCFGTEVSLTAAAGNAGAAPAYAWYLDGVLVPEATGSEFVTDSLQTGLHRIEVRLQADLTDGACIYPDTASAAISVRVHPLPVVEAYIADSVIKAKDSTWLWVESDMDMAAVAWSPAEFLLQPDSARTPTFSMTEPGWYVFRVEVANEHGCVAYDSVSLRVESDFKLDSVTVSIVVPPALPDGDLPGFPDNGFDPGDGTTHSTWVFYGDTAHLWLCAGNVALIDLSASGGAQPLTCTWSAPEGNVQLLLPQGAEMGLPYQGNDSVFGLFFPDTTTHEMQVVMEEAGHSRDSLFIFVHYYQPEPFYIEVRPKVLSGVYYEGQAVYFSARPQRGQTIDWIVMQDGVVDEWVTSQEPGKQLAFTHEDGGNSSVWISTVDPNGCRIWDSASVRIAALPNVMLVNDPKEGVIFPEFEVEITNMWGLRVKAFDQRNGNGQNKGWDGRAANGSFVEAGTYYYKVKIPVAESPGYKIVEGAVTVVNK